MITIIITIEDKPKYNLKIKSKIQNQKILSRNREIPLKILIPVNNKLHKIS